MMRFVVFGGRNYSNRELVFKTLDNLLKKHGKFVVVSGAASGADTLAADWARARSKYVRLEEYPAEWKKYGRAAGPIRNREMANAAIDMGICFEGGRGTAHMKSLLEDKGIPVIEPDRR